MTTSKRAILIFSIALAGSLAGAFFGSVLVSQFSDAPPWLLPAVVIGVVALALVALLSLPAAIRSRRQSRGHDNGA